MLGTDSGQHGRPVTLFTQRGERRSGVMLRSLLLGFNGQIWKNTCYFFDILSCTLTHSVPKAHVIGFLIFPLLIFFFRLDKCLFSTLMGLGFVDSFSVCMIHEYPCDIGTRNIIVRLQDERVGNPRLSVVSTYFFLVIKSISPESDMFDHRQSNKQSIIYAEKRSEWCPVARHDCFVVKSLLFTKIEGINYLICICLCRTIAC